MSVNWTEYSLGDLTDWLSGGTPSKKNDSFWHGEIPWLSATSMKGTYYSDSDLKISRKGLSAGSKLAPTGSLLLLVRGSSLHKYISIGVATRDVAFNQDVKAINIKKKFKDADVIDNSYLLHWFIAQKRKLLELVENTGIGAGKLDTKVLQELKIRVPDSTYRKKLVKFANAIEKQIIINQETNQLLEESAQTIFKSWFVDFDPVKAKIACLEAGGTEEDALHAAMSAISGKSTEELQTFRAESPEDYAELKATAGLFPSAMQESELGMIPEGWEDLSLKDLAKNNSRKFSFSDHEQVVFINTGDVQSGLFLHTDYSSPEGLPGQAKKAIKQEDILLSEIRPKNCRYLYVDQPCDDFVVSTKFMVLEHTPRILSRLLYIIVTRPEATEYFNMIAESRSGTFPQITFNSIDNYKVAIAPLEVQKRFIDTLAPTFNLQKNNYQQNKTLQKLRDTLLPKLLSGELTIPEAEEETPSV